VQEFTAKEILHGLKDRDTRVLDYIYDNFYFQIKVLVTKNHGSEEDARDIYQDALMVIYQKQQKDSLTLSCSFSTYLYSVCRLLWLKQLEKRKQHIAITEESGIFVEVNDNILDIFNLNEKYKLYQDHFNRLSFSCQKVLELFLAGIPLKEIANILGFKSEQYAKKRKYQCKEKLVNSIKSDPEYKKIKYYA
jgi:RNA polymerase sigma factor (sigma-70 family)